MGTRAGLCYDRRVEEDEPDAPQPAAANRTIQIDALTDVQLVDQVADEDGATDEGAAPNVSAPPPLPRKQAEAPRSNGRALALTFVAVLAGGFLAFLAVHYLMPARPAPTQAAAPPFTAATVASPPPTTVTPSEPPSEVRHVQIDEEMVIRAADPGE